MAGAGYKLFNTGDVLTAAQVNTYLQEQTVMVFANSTARTTALSGVLAEGMVSYLQDTNAVEVYNGSAWVGVSGAGDVTEVQAGTGISVASGTGPIPVVTNTMATEITAAGDIVVGTGSGTFDNLPIGTTGQVLTADTTVSPYKVKWATATGGGMTQLATGSLTGASVVISSISGSYKDLQLVVRNFLPANDADTLRCRINQDSTASRHYNNTYTTTGGAFGATSWGLTQGQDNSVDKSLVVLNIYDYANAVTWKFGNTLGITVDPTTTTQVQTNTEIKVYNQTTAISSLELFSSTGNFTSGTYILYGVS